MRYQYPPPPPRSTWRRPRIATPNFPRPATAFRGFVPPPHRGGSNPRANRRRWRRVVRRNSHYADVHGRIPQPRDPTSSGGGIHSQQPWRTAMPNPHNNGSGDIHSQQPPRNATPNPQNNGGGDDLADLRTTFGNLLREMEDLLLRFRPIYDGGLPEVVISVLLKTTPCEKPTAEIEDRDICFICQLNLYREEEEEDDDDRKLAGILRCGHRFHADCIREWLLRINSCPLCKQDGL